MIYGLEISKKAREQLRALPKELRRNIGWRMEEMREDLHGDVLKLQAKGNCYRLRVGSFRVLFLLVGNTIQVYAGKIGKMHMTDAAVIQKFEVLIKTVQRLEERVEDLEDLRDLQAAVAENGNEPLIPWEQAKAELELD